MNIERIQVQNAHRKTRRDIRKVFSDNFLKILTEVVLNADDSYKRIEKESDDSKIKEIVIMLDREQSVIKVLDNAEGMSAKQMEKIFGEYGGDYSGGDITNNVRGLFGQGAADVMFNSAMSKKIAQIESVKDGAVARCKFYFETNKEIVCKEIHPHIKQYRLNTGIKENGTLVTFGLSDKVKIPKENKIKEKIEKFYMFRYVLSNPLRKIILVDNGKKIVLSSKDYLLNKEKIILEKKLIHLVYDNRKMKAYLTLFEKKPNKDVQIIIRDENYVVYDETFFNRDKLPGANLLAGELVIPDIASLLRDLLNSDDPKELLTDTRDGFDGREEFTKNMNEIVGRIIEQEIEKNNSKRETISFNLNNNKRFVDIMKKINSYYSELELSSIEGLNPGSNPPVDGLRFARSTITITKGKTYDLKIYINSNQISTNDTIIITKEHNEHFSLNNSEISYSKDEIKSNNLVVKSVVIRSTKITDQPIRLVAKCNNYEAQVLVSVIQEKIIYPKNGLEFIPKRKTIKPNSKTEYSLYFDTDYIPLNSKIIIKKQFETQLLPEEEDVIITTRDILADNIGVVKVIVYSGRLEERILISAITRGITTSTILYVRNKEKLKDGLNGFLSKIELRFEDDIWQTTMNEAKGILYINGKHIINKNIMGDLGQVDYENPDFKKEQRKYLYELIAIESSRKIIKEIYNRGQYFFNNPDDVLDAIQEHKTTIYSVIAEI